MTSVQIELGWPAKALNPNSRDHFMTVSRLKRAAKDCAYWATKSVVPPAYAHDGTRIGFGVTAYPPDKRARDDDNLIASLKATRDGVAAALKTDDKLFDQKPIQWGEPVHHGKIVITLEMAA
jgi:crossover junction endodeoxyribonuclease RusA